MTPFSRLLALSAGLALAFSTSAQPFPSKPVKLVVPFVAGGGVDVLARVVSQNVDNRLGRPMIVENRPGAGGNIGAGYVAKAAPDGYTLLVAGVPQAISVSMYRRSRLAYDFVKDLAPLAAIASYPSVILVNPTIPARSFKELLALARSRPGELTFGSAGVGSPNHLAIELLKTQTRTEMVHVPYGSGSVVSDLIAGHLHLASLGIPLAMPHVSSGKLRAIAVTSARRSSVLPELPTLHESGVADFDVTSWYGVFAPAATPPAVTARLERALSDTLRSPEMVKALHGLLATPEGRTGEEFAHYVRQEVDRWAKVVEGARVRID